jgi:hypothetical protein
MTPHRLTTFFGVAVIGAAGAYVYRRLYPSVLEQGRQALEKKNYEAFERLSDEASKKKNRQTLHALGKLALEKGEYRQASKVFSTELSDTPIDYAEPYYWRNIADLKIDEFHRVRESNDKALMKDNKGNLRDKNLDKRVEAQLHLQQAQANLGLHELKTVRESIDQAISLYPATAKSAGSVLQRWLPIFREDEKYFPTQSRFLAQAEYLKAVLSFMEGKMEEVVAACDKALNLLSDTELMLAMEILALKALAYVETNNSKEAIKVAVAALGLEGSSKASKETLMTLHFCLAVSYCIKRETRKGFENFQKALDNVDNDPLLRGYILHYRGYFYRTIARELSSQREDLLRLAKEDFDEASKYTSDVRIQRCDQLVRCMLWSFLRNLNHGESPVTRLQDRIARIKATPI